MAGTEGLGMEVEAEVAMEGVTVGHGTPEDEPRVLSTPQNSQSTNVPTPPRKGAGNEVWLNTVFRQQTLADVLAKQAKTKAKKKLRYQ